MLKNSLLIILLLPSIGFCRSLRKVTDGSIDSQGRAAINTNFDNVQNQLNQKMDRNPNTIGASGSEVSHIYVDSITLTNLGSLFGYSVSTFTSNTSTGNQSITGVGFKPRLVVFFAGQGGSNFGQIGIGAMDSTGRQWAFAMTSNDSDSGGDSSINVGACIRWVDAAASTDFSASYVSMDSDGFTINWTTALGVAKTIGYIAFQ